MTCAAARQLLLLMVLLPTALPIPHYLSKITQGSSHTCAGQFTLHNSFCYRYFGNNLEKVFHHAQKLCSRYQSSLLSLHSSHEEVFIKSLINLNQSIWLGLNDEEEVREGVFRWSSGERFVASDSSTYCNWKYGEPENRKHLDCVTLDAEGWAVAQSGCGSTRLAFICKKKACPADQQWDNTQERCVLINDVATPTTRQSATTAPTAVYSGVVIILFVLCVMSVVAVTLFLCASRTTRQLQPS